MTRCLVISYNSDEQQFYYDFILADSPDAAKETILSLREYCEDADVLTGAELTQMAGRLSKASDKSIQNWIDELKAEHTERNGEPEPVKPVLDKQAEFQARLKAVGTTSKPRGADYIRFDNLTADAAQALLDSGAAEPDDQQIEAPNFAAMVAFLHANSAFTAHGYIIGPGREDERITIEGVFAKQAPWGQVKNFTSVFRQADEFDCVKGNYPGWYD